VPNSKIISALSSGLFDLSRHALQRMRERGARRSDLMHAAWRYTYCDEIEPGKFEIAGPDEDGDELVIIAVEDNGVLVVTIFGGRDEKESS
jgi:hypothetical protein